MRIKLHSRKKIVKIKARQVVAQFRADYGNFTNSWNLFFCCFHFLCIHCVLPSLLPPYQLARLSGVASSFFPQLFLSVFWTTLLICFFFGLTFANLFSPPMSLCVVRCVFFIFGPVYFILNCTTALLCL